MMLHRHFEQEKSKNVTTLEDVTPKVKGEPPEELEEAPKRRGRPRKTDE